ncbi:HIT domain-containing protein [Curtobacterium sp. MCSS17_007]|uniref:HIT family protein n=1 Tax=Curtobacterium sp. MCSS17_007 TaxID=2175646 RepID=UPI0015E8D150|nr:HIT domain-containing protein [Curtobacterium sp. MCSS17_007]WIE77114.1 HIT domain-containing protein [Curtobacterium sp. MCSS17_007]
MDRTGGTEHVPGTGHVVDVAGSGAPAAPDASARTGRTSAAGAAGTGGADDPLVIRDAATGAAVPDAFQRLWNPHRMAYIDAGRDGEGRGHRDDCPFCEAPRKSDEDALIVARGEHAYVLLNLYPYNNGHLLVCPYRHVPLYDEATPEETREIAELTQTAMRVLRAVSHCDGFNIGMNQGEIAGAGVAAHLHQHIVPRWASDSNFFPIIARTKSMSQLLGDTRRLVAEGWPAAD